MSNVFKKLVEKGCVQLVKKKYLVAFFIPGDKTCAYYQKQQVKNEKYFIGADKIFQAVFAFG